MNGRSAGSPEGGRSFPRPCQHETHQPQGRPGSRQSKIN
ncbi:hypothetical protein ATKI12_7866 [Kitasatospora sp. Ki12]